MDALLIIVIILLTFLLTLINRFLEFLERFGTSFIKVLLKNSAYVWFIIIMLIGLVGWKKFGIVPPKEGLHFDTKGLLYIILGIGLFGLLSGYSPSRKMKGILIFCLLFPIGEEILFRGIIQSICNFIMSDNLLYVPMPLLKGMTVQVFISALCFGITHFQYFGFKLDSSTIRKVLFAFIFGLFAGNIVEITGSVFYTVLFHILANVGATIHSLVVTKENNATTV